MFQEELKEQYTKDELAEIIALYNTYYFDVMDSGMYGEPVGIKEFATVDYPQIKEDETEQA